MPESKKGERVQMLIEHVLPHKQNAITSLQSNKYHNHRLTVG